MVGNHGGSRPNSSEGLDDHRRRRRRSWARDRGAARVPRGARSRAARPGARGCADTRPGTPRAVDAVRRRNTPDRGLSPRASCGARRRRWPRRACGGPRPESLPRRSRARRRPARRSSAGVGGSVARWRSVWRTTPAWVETWKPTSSPRPTTSSVEPPPMSMTTSARVARRALARRAAEGQPRLLVAVDDPRVEAVVRRATRARKASPLAASRTALVSTATRPLGALLVDRPAVLGEGREHPRHRLVAQDAGLVEAVAEPRDLGPALELGQPCRRRRRRRRADASSSCRCRRRRPASRGRLTA